MTSIIWVSYKVVLFPWLFWNGLGTILATKSKIPHCMHASALHSSRASKVQCATLTDLKFPLKLFEFQACNKSCKLTYAELITLHVCCMHDVQVIGSTFTSSTRYVPPCSASPLACRIQSHCQVLLIRLYLLYQDSIRQSLEAVCVCVC